MARLLSQLIGHESAVQHLLAAVQADRMPSTVLLTGPSGVGRSLLARGIAQALVCERTNSACGECPSCLRIAKNESEALLVLQPEKAQIKIEQARSVLEFLSLRSISKSRVIIIDPADSLNPQAANALLKILEEPPENTYFFLIAPSPRHVLPTLRSRSQQIRLQKLEPRDLKKKGAAPEWALQLANGSFERLAEILTPESQQARATLMSYVDRWFNGDPAYLSDQQRDDLGDRESLLAFARLWVLLVRDALVLRAGGRDQVLQKDQLQKIETLSRFDVEVLGELCNRGLYLEEQIQSQKDLRLSFEEFWIQTRRKAFSGGTLFS